MEIGTFCSALRQEIFVFAERNKFLAAKKSSVVRRKWPEKAGSVTFLCGKTDFPGLFVDSDGKRLSRFFLLFVRKTQQTVSIGILVFYGWMDWKMLIFASKFVFSMGIF